MEKSQTALRKRWRGKARIHPIDPGQVTKDRLTRYVVVFMLFVILYTSPHALALAGMSEDLMPGSNITSPFYQRYDISAYQLDYVPPDNVGALELDERFYWGVNLLLNVGWMAYVYLVEFGIRIVNWIFDTKLANEMIGLLDAILPDLFNVLWDDFWWLAFGFGFLGVALVFAFGRSLDALLKMLTIVLIITLAPLIPVHLPDAMRSANEGVTIIGGEVLNALITTEIDEQIDQEMAEQAEQRQQLLGGHSPLLSQGVEQQIQIIRGVHAVNDALVKSMIYKTWLIANYGSIEVGEKYANEHLRLGSDKDARRAYLKRVGEIDSNGKAGNEEFVIFTSEGFITRVLNANGAMWFPLAVMAVIIWFAIVVLIWTARAIGRACLLVFYALMSLWPGYGASEFAHSFFQTFVGFLMKLFYTTALAVVLAIWNTIQDNQLFPNLNLMGSVIVLFVLLKALWDELSRLRSRFNNIPGVQGGQYHIGGSNELDAIPNAANRVGQLATKQALMMYNMNRAGRFGGSNVAAIASMNQTGRSQGSMDLYRETRNLLREQYPMMKKRLSHQMAPKEGKVVANLGEDERNVYAAMVRSGKDPTNAIHRQQWARENPKQKELLENIADWSRQRVDKMGTRGKLEEGAVIPPPAPLKDTPEYAIWKRSPQWQQNRKLWEMAEKEVHQKKFEEYAQRTERYEQRSIFGVMRRLTMRQPQMVEPSKLEIMKAYQKKLDEQNPYNSTG